MLDANARSNASKITIALNMIGITAIIISMYTTITNAIACDCEY